MSTGNHVGEGATLSEFLRNQSGVQFVINGGFNHYRDWETSVLAVEHLSVKRQDLPLTVLSFY